MLYIIKLKYIISTLSCFMFLTACSYNDNMEIGEGIYHNYEQHVALLNNSESTIDSTSLNNYMQQSINNFKGNYDFEVDISALILDIDSNTVIGHYGDIERDAKTHYAFWPISAAILINEYNLDIYKEFENTPYVFKDGGIIRSPIAVFSEEDYHTGYISFIQAFMDGNDSIFFHAIEDEDLNAYYNTIQELNLKLDVTNYDSKLDEIPYEIIGYNVYSNVTQMALIYSTLVNGGKLFMDTDSEEYVQIFDESTGVQTLELLQDFLWVADENWSVLYNVENEERFKTNIIGTISESADFYEDELSVWFTGFYPAENPKYVAVFRLSHDLDYLQYMIRMHDFSIVIDDIMNYLIENTTSIYEFNEDKIVYSDFLPRIEEIDLLVNDEFTGYLYVGRDTCPYCLEFNVYLEEIYINNEELLIYFFDTDFWRDNNSFNLVIEKYNINEIPALLNILDNGEFEAFAIDSINSVN